VDGADAVAGAAEATGLIELPLPQAARARVMTSALAGRKSWGIWVLLRVRIVWAIAGVDVERYVAGPAAGSLWTGIVPG
jgi:hypothetical protein